MTNKLPGQITDDIVSWYKRRGLKIFRLDMRERDRFGEVIPLKTRGKKPRYSGWQKSNIPWSRIRDCANNGENFALAIPDGMIVLDIDPRNGGTIDAVLDLLNLDFLDLDDIASTYPVVLTGGGGYHIYMSVAKGLKIEGKLDGVQGVDVKHKGGYVVVPGSYHYLNKKLYEWYDKGSEGLRYTKIPRAPHEILKRIEKKVSSGDRVERVDSSPNLTSEELESLLNKIDVEQYRGKHDDWLHLMFACHHATNGDGLPAFLAWCTGDPVYLGDADNIVARWESTSIKEDGGGITYLHLLDTVYEHNEKSEDLIPKSIRVKCDIAKFDAFETAAIEGTREVNEETELFDDSADLFDEDDDEDKESQSEHDALAQVLRLIDGYKKNFVTLKDIERVAQLSISFDDVVQGTIKKQLMKKSGLDLKTVKDTFLSYKTKALNRKLNKELSTSLEGLFVLEDMAAAAAKMVFRKFKNGNHLCSTNNEIYQYDGKVWQRMHDDELGREASKAVAGIDNKTKKVATVSKDAVILIKQFARRVNFTEENRSRKHDVFNFANCEVWVSRKTGTPKVKAHRYSSYQTRILPYEYDPTAECPVFERTLRSMFSDKEDTKEVFRHIVELMGYSLSSYKNIATIVVLVGSGGNGKTVLLNALKNITGSYALNISLLELRNRFTRAKLFGRRVVIDEDFAVDEKLPNEMIKKLSETKIIEVDQKFKEGFELESETICWLASNAWPYTGDSTNAIIRRMHFISFDRTFMGREADNTLNDKIALETPGVFNLALRGLQNLRLRGDFSKPNSVLAAKERWAQNTNSVSLFMDEFRENGNTDRYVNVKSLFTIYREWCEECKIARPYPRTVFKKILTELGCEQMSRGFDLPLKYINFSFFEKALDECNGEMLEKDIRRMSNDTINYSHIQLRDYCISKGYEVKQRGHRLIRVDATEIAI